MDGVVDRSVTEATYAIREIWIDRKRSESRSSSAAPLKVSRRGGL
jgi:hypothetical protein